MNEDTTVTAPVTTKPKRKPKPTKPRTPRVIDPAEQAIKDAAKAQIELYRQGLKSGDVLKRIQELVPKLTPEHQVILLAQLQAADLKNIAAKPL